MMAGKAADGKEFVVCGGITGVIRRIVPPFEVECA
jgi:hypothetical protein